MKNMKIEINEQQPLDDVVRELERLGRKYLVVATVFEGKGNVLISQLNACNCVYPEPVFETTLAELKEMKQ